MSHASVQYIWHIGSKREKCFHLGRICDLPDQGNNCQSRPRLPFRTDGIIVEVRQWCVLYTSEKRLHKKEKKGFVPMSRSAWGVRCSLKGPITCNERLIVSTCMRKMEKQQLLMVYKALEICTIVMPTAKSIKKWKSDRQVKQDLEDHLRKHCKGSRRTWNPCNLKPPLEWLCSTCPCCQNKKEEAGLTDVIFRQLVWCHSLVE